MVTFTINIPPMLAYIPYYTIHGSYGIYCFGMFWVSCELATRHSKDHPRSPILKFLRGSSGSLNLPKFSMGDLQDPKMEVPTIYKAYFLGLCKGISPENMALNGTVPPI